MAASDASLAIARRSSWRDEECLELVCGISNAGGGRLILDADVDSRGAVKRRTNRMMKAIPGIIAQSLSLTCAVELVLDSGRFCLEVVIPPPPSPSATTARSSSSATARTTSLTTRPSTACCSAIWKWIPSGSCGRWCRRASTT